jgi:hypothetical protein
MLDIGSTDKKIAIESENSKQFLAELIRRVRGSSEPRKRVAAVQWCCAIFGMDSALAIETAILLAGLTPHITDLNKNILYECMNAYIYLCTHNKLLISFA